MSFGRAERAVYKKHILDVYGRFLKKCYSEYLFLIISGLLLFLGTAIEECRSRALPDEEGFENLDGMDLGVDTAEVHTVFVKDLESTVFGVPGDGRDVPLEGGSSHVVQASGRGAVPDDAPSQVVTPHPSPRAPSLSFLSPNPSRPPSPSTELPDQARLSAELEGRATAAEINDTGPSDSCPPASAQSTIEETTVPIEAPLSFPDSTTKRPHKQNSSASSSNHRNTSRHHSNNQNSVNTIPKKRTRNATDDKVPNPPSKRLRDSNNNNDSDAGGKQLNASAFSTFVIPSNAPSWLVKALHMFEEPGLDKRWVELVQVWISFEQNESYLEVGKLSSKNRPAVVGQWIARARSSTWRPNISDLCAFEDQFRQWWLNIQPPWRVSDGMLLKDSVDGDWGSLRCPGLNGIYSVLAALLYWGLAAKKLANKKAWVAAVQDCQVVLRHLLSSS